MQSQIGAELGINPFTQLARTDASVYVQLAGFSRRSASNVKFRGQGLP